MQEESVPPLSSRKVNPWVSIWTQPRIALDYVLRHQREEYLHRLLMAHGIFFMLLVRVPDWLTSQPDPVGVMIQLFLVGPVLGITLGYVQAALLGWAYSWGGMTVDAKLIRPLVAWTGMPFMLSIVCFLVAYAALHFSLPQEFQFEIWLGRHPSGRLAIAAGLLPALYAIWIRARAISLLFSVGMVKALALWLVGFLATYVPFFLMVFLYFSIFYVTIIGPGR
jgi:hypothetical protein